MSLLDSLLNPAGKPAETRASPGTGMWPYVKPRPWNLEPAPGEAVIIDPVAVASEAARELRNVGWPGIALMDQDFQMALLDAPPDSVGSMVEGWFARHSDAVCDALQSRLGKYDVEGLSGTANAAMTEAPAAYRAGLYLSVVRVLLPEFECFARALVLDKTQKYSQNRVIEDLKALLSQTPVIKDDPLSRFHFSTLSRSICLLSALLKQTRKVSGRCPIATPSCTGSRAMAPCKARLRSSV